MEGTIVCFVGDYAICKNNESGEVFNVNIKNIQNGNEGDYIVVTEQGVIVKYNKKEKYGKNNKFEDCYIYDDVLIEIRKE